MKFKHAISSEISLSYIVTKKKLTLIAALGVTIGLAVFVFMNSMMKGFDRISGESIFKSVAHIRLYKDDEISKPLPITEKDSAIRLIINPRIVPENNVLVNPEALLLFLEKQENVTVVSPQTNLTVFYNNGKSQINGTASGINIDAADRMFNIHSTMVEGNLGDLKNVQNGIILGVGIAAKMNVKTGDNISISSSKNVVKVLRVIGLFRTNNSNTDKSKSYINIALAQQLLLKSSSYITDINVNIKDFENAKFYADKFSSLTGYKAEDWKSANETLMAAARMRKIIITVISFSILIVAGFGIYNILNMTISQKLNDIAILKAMGFKGKDVIRIFVQQALLIGVMGIALGLTVATILVNVLQHVYVGGDIGYFPIRFEPSMYVRGIFLGLIVTFFAGYIPAKKAANVDPVSIFRK
ncbi:MAG: ABC transporter permease [Bacteroidetes bacterium]|nr:ABC transporter permease [Bacteroidota bacterium]